MNDSRLVFSIVLHRRKNMLRKAEYIEKYGEEVWKAHLENHKEYQKQWREQHNEYYKQYSRKYNRMFAYCIPEEIELIENYELAKKDNFNSWCIHHRLECVETGAVVNSTKQDLIDWGIYYNRPASELIFLTKSEHCKLHRKKNNREVF